MDGPGDDNGSKDDTKSEETQIGRAKGSDELGDDFTKVGEGHDPVEDEVT